MTENNEDTYIIIFGEYMNRLFTNKKFSGLIKEVTDDFELSIVAIGFKDKINMYDEGELIDEEDEDEEHIKTRTMMNDFIDNIYPNNTIRMCESYKLMKGDKETIFNSAGFMVFKNIHLNCTTTIFNEIVSKYCNCYGLNYTELFKDEKYQNTFFQVIEYDAESG